MTPRQTSLLAAVAFAVVSPIVQSLGEVGLSPAAFARSGDQTLRAAGYVFSIWSVIYAGLLAFAVFQAQAGRRHDRLLARLAGPALVAIVGTGLWIWASAADARWVSVIIITGSAAGLTFGLRRSARTTDTPDLRERLLIWWPLTVLAGWLTLASAINILTVLTAEDLIAGHERLAAVSGLAAVFMATLFVLRTPRMATYGLPVAWGLVAVWVAEYRAKPDIAAMAIGMAVLIGGYAAWQTRPRTLASKSAPATAHDAEG